MGNDFKYDDNYNHGFSYVQDHNLWHEEDFVSNYYDAHSYDDDSDYSYDYKYSYQAHACSQDHDSNSTYHYLSEPKIKSECRYDLDYS